MLRIISVAHALQLHHIDLIREMPIKEGIIDIKLPKSPLAIEGNAKHSTNGDEIYHRTKSLLKFNAQLLVIAFSMSFILCNNVVGILLDVKHQFVIHNILPRSRGN